MDFTHLKPKIQPSLAISPLLTTYNPSKTIFISLPQKLTTINPFILGAEQFKTDVGQLRRSQKNYQNPKKKHTPFESVFTQTIKSQIPLKELLTLPSGPVLR
ncbi:hypothetical protein MKX50_06375 [Paenibacillus sp. FSL W8-0186]|uniref:hypothetical protein n=1 Tax=Paenibacillus TaxID=44249 RepID=UPI001BCD6416|nr:hypothetical protein [Paenibacillus woosongensis]